MEPDIADELIDFYGNEDIANNILALALLEPLKQHTDNPMESTEAANSIEEIIDEVAEIKDVVQAVPLTGDKAFLRDHNLLARLIIHPKMTLAKILKVYPNLPYEKFYNKNAELKILLREWLPLVAKYSREYLVVKTSEEVDINEMVTNILMLMDPRMKKRKANKDKTIGKLNISKNCSLKK